MTDKVSDKVSNKVSDAGKSMQGSPPPVQQRRDKSDTKTQEPKNLDQGSGAPATPGEPPNTSDD